MTPAQTNAARTRAYVAARARWVEAMGHARGLLEAGVATRRFCNDTHNQLLLRNAEFATVAGSRLHLPTWDDYDPICHACGAIFGSAGPVAAYIADWATVDRFTRVGAITNVEAAEHAIVTDLHASLCAIDLGWALAYLTNDYLWAVPSWEAPDA